MQTRATVIPFKEPQIGPVSEDEDDTFAEFESLLSSGVLSSMVGWAIQQGKTVATTDGKEEVLELKESIRGIFQGRNCQNWALLLFFVKEVGLQIVVTMFTL